MSLTENDNQQTGGLSAEEQDRKWHRLWDPSSINPEDWIIDKEAIAELREIVREYNIGIRAIEKATPTDPETGQVGRFFGYMGGIHKVYVAYITKSGKVFIDREEE